MPKTDDKLDTIIEHLKRMDRRDRLRMAGGFIRGLITIIPVLAFIWGGWYFYNHGEEVMAKIARQAAEQAAEVTKQGTEGLMQQLQGTFKVQ